MKAAFALGAIASIFTTANAASAAGTNPTIIAHPLYCRGALDMEREAPSFVWASTIAKKAAPESGQCSWPDRIARGEELHASSHGASGLLCPVYAFEFPIGSFRSGQYFVINVTSDPIRSAENKSPCLTPAAAPVALTPETRPWPVEKRPGDGPKPAL